MNSGEKRRIQREEEDLESLHRETTEKMNNEENKEGGRRSMQHRDRILTCKTPDIEKALRSREGEEVNVNPQYEQPQSNINHYLKENTGL